MSMYGLLIVVFMYFKDLSTGGNSKHIRGEVKNSWMDETGIFIKSRVLDDKDPQTHRVFFRE